MRIAVSGTHCCGKSTLIASFLAAHRDFVHEPEPYEWLVALYGEELSQDPGPDDFLRQLQVSLGRVEQYQHGARVVFERSPVDFVAYLQALGALRMAADALPLVERGLQQLDAILFLPLDINIPAPDDEDPELRLAVDEQLVRILLDDEFGLFEGKALRVIEAPGAIPDRLAMFESLLDRPLP